MIAGKSSYSIANPTLGSIALGNPAISSFYGFITFSVGTQINLSTPYQYVTQPENGDDVTITIKDGVLEFSYPQTHPYVGVGDSVVFGDPAVTVFLNKKISTRKWEVKGYTTHFGNPADVSTPATLIRIDKTFDNLRSAIDTESSESLEIIGSSNLYSLRSRLRIALYEMDDTITSPISIKGWTVDEGCCVQIFTPYNLKTECNKSQRHAGKPGNCYRLISNNSDATISIQTSYTIIEGLHIDGNNRNDNIFISYDSLSLSRTKIIDCLLGGGGYAIGATLVPSDNQIIKGNTIWDITYDAIGGAHNKITAYNNTVYGCGAYGINLTVDNATCRLRNNLFQQCTIKCVSTADPVNDDIDYCIVDDESVEGLGGNHQLTTIIFRDSANENFTLFVRSDDVAVRDGIALSSDAYYAFDTDILHSKIDESWSIGSHHYVRELRLSIFYQSVDDLKTGAPTVTMVDPGIMVFSVAQTDYRLCSGFVVNLASGDKALLWEKIDNSTWIVTNVADPGQSNFLFNSLVTSITSTFSTQYFALTQGDALPEGTPGIVPYMGDDTPVESDLKVVIYCSFGNEPVGTETTIDINSDETRNITIKTPNDVDVDCNTSRRHNGAWDDDKYGAKTTGGNTFNVNCDYLTIDGLQITVIDGSSAICISSGKNFTIINNIIYGAGDDGIKVISDDASSNSVIANNLIYDCECAGIDIFHGNFVQDNSYIQIYNNTIICKGQGIFIWAKPNEPYTLAIRLVNNLVQGIPEIGVGEVEDRKNGPDYQGRNYQIINFNPDLMSIISCWSQDDSLNRFEGINNKVNQELHFDNTVNYRLLFSDSLIMTDVEDLRADGDYSFEYDFRGNLRNEIKWNVGSDNFVISSDKLANFSVGTNSGNLDTDPDDRTAILSNSIMTFNGSTLAETIGVGDKITFHDSDVPATLLYCYLSEKGDENTWIVRDNNGNPSSDTLPSITGTIEIDSIKRVSSTFVNALDSSGSEDIETELDLGSKDISSNSIKVFVWGYADSIDDSAGPLIEGWTCSSDYPISIATPYDIVTQCNSRQRHSGIFSGDFFMLQPTSGDGFVINNQYVHLEGFQIMCESGDYGIKVTAPNGGYNKIKCNIIKNTKNGIYIEDAVIDCQVCINIIYKTTGTFEIGIRTKSGWVLGNTIVNFTAIGVSTASAPLYDVTLSHNLAITNEGAASCYATTPNNTLICISSDNTATGYGSIPNAKWDSGYVGINFQDPASGDYHLRRDDVLAICSAGDMNTAFIDRDIDSEKIPIGRWCIGADSIADIETIDLYFSASKDTSNLRSGEPTGSIVSGIMTFSIAQEDDQLGIGDVVDYDLDNKNCYLYEKRSQTEWIVRTKYGIIPDDITDAVINSIKHVFDDFSFFPFTIRGYLGGIDLRFTDMVRAAYKINIPFYKSTTKFTHYLVVNGFTTDKNNYFRLYTPTDIVKECNTRQRHSGWYKSAIHTSAVIFETAGGIVATIQLYQNYTVFDGIIVIPGALTNPGEYNHGILLESTLEIVVSGCIIIDSRIGIDITNDDYYEPIHKNVIVNNIILRSITAGIICGGEDFVCNNTIIDSTQYGIANASTDIVYNNIVQGSGVGDYFDDTYIEYCVSSDSTAGTNEGCQINTLVNFIDPANDDYHLSKNDILIRGAARQLVYSNCFNFSVDAANVQRGHRWDLGALEFETRHVYYSVGALNIDVKTSTGSLSFEIVKYENEREINNYSIITFGEDQLGPSMGIGCEVRSLSQSTDFPNGCLISGKIDRSNWLVTDYLGYPVDEKAGTVESIKRPYQSLSNAVTGLFEGLFSIKNLPYQEIQLNIACYDDDVPDESTTTIELVISDVDFYLRIYSPHDTDYEVNKSQRHTGKPRTGFYIKPIRFDLLQYLLINFGGNLSDLDEGNYVIKASETDYIEIEGVSMMLEHGLPGYGIWINSCKNYFLSYNIISDCFGDGIYTDVALDRSDDFIVNNLIINCIGDGISTGSRRDTVQTIDPGSKTFIFNNTIYNCLRGIHLNNIVTENFVTGICINNICQLSKYQDYVNEYPTNGDSLQISYSVSSDDSVDIYGGTNNDKNKIIQFINAGSEDFNLLTRKDYAAIDSGLDLSEDSLIAYADDIISRNREPGFWDRGAFETVGIEGVGELLCGPISIEGICMASSITPTLEIHLRKPDHDLPDVINKHSITEINDFLTANIVYESYNLIIYVEGNESFDGTFAFKERLGSKTVTVKTYPPEKHNGLSSILYDGYLVDDVSKQSLLMFEDLKIYSNNEDDSYDLISSSGATKKLRFVNCIIQLNNNKIVTIAGCIAQVVNSILIYRNKGNEDTCYLSDNDSLGDYAYNSIFLTFSNYNIGFQLSTALSNDPIINCMTYNYNTSFLFPFTCIPTTLTNCQQDVNPIIDEFLIEERLFVISDLMAGPFMLKKTSPAINTGNNTVIPADVETDIVGNPRIFNFGIVDLGPREMQIHQLSFGSNNIQSVFQDKIFINFATKQCFFAKSDLILNDLYHQFDDNPEYREEFLKESKIVILLKSLRSDFITYTDKIDKLVNSFEAYYDSEAMAIVIKKDFNVFGELFSNIFKDGRYVFEFNEIQSLLSVYINDTYDKGPSGDKNPVKNIKFGGTSLVLN